MQIHTPPHSLITSAENVHFKALYILFSFIWIINKKLLMHDFQSQCVRPHKVCVFAFLNKRHLNENVKRGVTHKC